MDADNSIERCMDVTTRTLHEVFAALYQHGVVLERMLLKPNMVVPGYKSGQKATPEQVAELTLECLRRNVPAQVPGIVFLSGGLSDEDATHYLDVMNKVPGARPWKLSFSYGRALQAAALKAWQGKQENREKTQKAFLKRARLNGLAAKGEYDAKLEEQSA